MVEEKERTCKKCGQSFQQKSTRSWNICPSCWNEYIKGRLRKYREDAIAKLGAACMRCGNTDVRVLRVLPPAGMRQNVKLYLYIRKNFETIDKASFPVYCLNCMELLNYE